MTRDLTRWASAALSQALAALDSGDVRVKLTRPAHPRASHVLDLDGTRGIGQFIVWPDGATEATILDVATEQRVYFEDAPAMELDEVDVRFRAFLDAFREADKPPS